MWHSFLKVLKLFPILSLSMLLITFTFGEGTAFAASASTAKVHAVDTQKVADHSAMPLDYCSWSYSEMDGTNGNFACFAVNYNFSGTWTHVTAMYAHGNYVLFEDNYGGDYSFCPGGSLTGLNVTIVWVETHSYNPGYC